MMTNSAVAVIRAFLFAAAGGCGASVHCPE